MPSSAEKRDARQLQHELGVPYTEALLRVRRSRDGSTADPTPAGIPAVTLVIHFFGAPIVLTQKQMAAHERTLVVQSPTAHPLPEGIGRVIDIASPASAADTIRDAYRQLVDEGGGILLLSEPFKNDASADSFGYGQLLPKSTQRLLRTAHSDDVHILWYDRLQRMVELLPYADELHLTSSTSQGHMAYVGRRFNLDQQSYKTQAKLGEHWRFARERCELVTLNHDGSEQTRQVGGAFRPVDNPSPLQVWYGAPRGEHDKELHQKLRAAADNGRRSILFVPHTGQAPAGMPGETVDLRELTDFSLLIPSCGEHLNVVYGLDSTAEPQDVDPRRRAAMVVSAYEELTSLLWFLPDGATIGMEQADGVLNHDRHERLVSSVLGRGSQVDVRHLWSFSDRPPSKLAEHIGEGSGRQSPFVA